MERCVIVPNLCLCRQLAAYPGQWLDPGPDNLRKKAHVDSGALTLLVSDDWQHGSGWDPTDGGLQLMTSGGEWVQVVVPPGGRNTHLSMVFRW